MVFAEREPMQRWAVSTAAETMKPGTFVVAALLFAHVSQTFGVSTSRTSCRAGSGAKHSCSGEMDAVPGYRQRWHARPSRLVYFDRNGGRQAMCLQEAARESWRATWKPLLRVRWQSICELVNCGMQGEP